MALASSEKIFDETESRRITTSGGGGLDETLALRAALIPHAGKQYAGAARRAAFELMGRPVTHIIYIATIHEKLAVYARKYHTGGSPGGAPWIEYPSLAEAAIELGLEIAQILKMIKGKLHQTGGYEFKLEPCCVYTFTDSAFKLLENNKTCPICNADIQQRLTPPTAPETDPALRGEHSYYWVEPELQEYFPGAEILAVGVKQFSPELETGIVEFMQKYPHCILLATTDLTHYGPSFGNAGTLEYPQQRAKQHAEEGFIKALVAKPLNLNDIEAYTEQKDLLCGPAAVALFARVVSRLQYSGKVVDYYDSSGSSVLDRLNRYVIVVPPVESFVSYVAIVYGPGKQNTNLSDFDIMMAIATVKSNLLAHVYRRRYHVYLPSWSPFYKKTQGVFVGTSLQDKTNCSYGRYEDGASTAEKITEAALDCPTNASDHWKMPYSEDVMDKLKYKVELLQPEKDWRPLANLLDFPLDGRHGMYLTLPTKQFATYLPVVARDSEWEITDYLRALAAKAGGTDWRGATAKVYTSNSYTWNPQTQKLEFD